MAGFSVVFGYAVPTSLRPDANVPSRLDLDSIRGGQAAVAVGYKSNPFGRRQHALLIRSAWGSGWGDNGDGWLPIAFLRSQLAKDFWTLVSARRLDSGESSRPSVTASITRSIRRVSSGAFRLPPPFVP